LHKAVAEKSDLKMIRLLLAYKADVTATTTHTVGEIPAGSTPYSIARHYHYRTIAYYLRHARVSSRGVFSKKNNIDQALPADSLPEAPRKVL
jgi:hypothetical protein